MHPNKHHSSRRNSRYPLEALVGYISVVVVVDNSLEENSDDDDFPKC